MKTNKLDNPGKALAAVQLILAYEWLNSGIGKFTKPEFMAGIDKTLATFANKTNFSWYGDFLGSANAQLFGNITRLSEVLIGLGLLAGIAYLIKRSLPGWILWASIVAAFGGALLNLNLYLAAGWSSPSTAGINVVMGLTQLVLGWYLLTVALKK